MSQMCANLNSHLLNVNDTFVMIMDNLNCTCWVSDLLGDGWVGGHAVYSEFTDEGVETSAGEYFEFRPEDHDYEDSPITCVITSLGRLITPEDGKSVYLGVSE